MQIFAAVVHGKHLMQMTIHTSADTCIFAANDLHRLFVCSALPMCQITRQLVSECRIMTVCLHWHLHVTVSTHSSNADMLFAVNIFHLSSHHCETNLSRLLSRLTAPHLRV